MWQSLPSFDAVSKVQSCHYPRVQISSPQCLQYSPDRSVGLISQARCNLHEALSTAYLPVPTPSPSVLRFLYAHYPCVIAYPDAALVLVQHVASKLVQAGPLGSSPSPATAVLQAAYINDADTSSWCLFLLPAVCCIKSVVYSSAQIVCMQLCEGPRHGNIYGPLIHEA